MVSLDTSKRRAATLPALPTGNPDGKGVNGVLLDWYRTAPRDVVAKPARQILSELFTSMLALSAAFRYRPVVGNPNYLYWINGGWSLSLVGPDEWSSNRREAFAGTCVLQRDMTWTIALSERLTKNNPVVNALRRFYDGFVDALDSDLALEAILPIHADRIPYYPRLHASAMSRGLRASMNLGDQAVGHCRQWRALLPEQPGRLLAQEA